MLPLRLLHPKIPNLKTSKPQNLKPQTAALIEMSDPDTEQKPSRRLWIFAAAGALALHLGGGVHQHIERAAAKRDTIDERRDRGDIAQIGGNGPGILRARGERKAHGRVGFLPGCVLVHGEGHPLARVRGGAARDA